MNFFLESPSAFDAGSCIGEMAPPTSPKTSRKSAIPFALSQIIRVTRLSDASCRELYLYEKAENAFRCIL